MSLPKFFNIEATSKPMYPAPIIRILSPIFSLENKSSAKITFGLLTISFEKEPVAIIIFFAFIVTPATSKLFLSKKRALPKDNSRPCFSKKEL